MEYGVYGGCLLCPLYPLLRKNEYQILGETVPIRYSLATNVNTAMFQRKNLGKVPVPAQLNEILY